MKVLSLQNRQRTRAIDLGLLKKVARNLIEEALGRTSYELGIHLVSADEMASINETFLQHTGSTDVITFDHNESLAKNLSETFQLPKEAGADAEFYPALFGEIYISIDDAVKQAREFRTSWQSELIRYVAHGVLHLEGFDDLKLAARRKMRREENRLVKELATRFPVSKLAGSSKSHSKSAIRNPAPVRKDSAIR